MKTLHKKYKKVVMIETEMSHGRGVDGGGSYGRGIVGTGSYGRALGSVDAQGQRVDGSGVIAEAWKKDTIMEMGCSLHMCLEVM